MTEEEWAYRFTKNLFMLFGIGLGAATFALSVHSFCYSNITFGCIAAVMFVVVNAVAIAGVVCSRRIARMVRD